MSLWCIEVGPVLVADDCKVPKLSVDGLHMGRPPLRPRLKLSLLRVTDSPECSVIVSGSLMSGLTEIRVEDSKAFEVIGWVGVLPGLVCGNLVVGGTIPSLPSIVLTGCRMEGVGRVLELAVLNLGGSCAANSVSTVHLLVVAV